MKTTLALAVLIALAPCAVLAATNDPAPKETAAKNTVKPKDCSTIKSTTVRQACLDRQAADNPAKPTSSMTDAVDKLKQEDDRLAKKLKSICRGC